MRGYTPPWVPVSPQYVKPGLQPRRRAKVLPGHLSQHAKAANAEGLTFSDPIHKKVREI
jgi:hypothetical protein